ncbi:hypothetical protein PINS_up019947 [Pythium insidiosum]|nr:hypothetical protein PINS_up019947 [Pythium insidiosum]
MPHSFGYRARTRDMFARPFRQRGMIKLSTYLRTFKVGDYVDIKANGAIHKGMPHKFYHGPHGPCVQRHQACRWRACEQGGRQPHHPQAHQRAH